MTTTRKLLIASSCTAALLAALAVPAVACPRNQMINADIPAYMAALESSDADVTASANMSTPLDAAAVAAAETQEVDVRVVPTSGTADKAE